jgi:hypothetical protein
MKTVDTYCIRNDYVTNVGPIPIGNDNINDSKVFQYRGVRQSERAD